MERIEENSGVASYENVPADIIRIQNDHIRAYAKAHGLKIGKTYSDRKSDLSERTAFNQMLKDGMQREFDLVITDSIRRCGINIWEAQEVLMQTFFPAGIQFVIVEDDFCSIGKSLEEVEAYFNEARGKFNIEKLKNQVNTRNRKGILSWNDVKYGYRLTEDYQLKIDDETAPVVKRIFELCADGMSCRDVAKLLSAERIPSPLSKRGMNIEIKDPYKWTREGVSRLVEKTVYAGHWVKVVQGQEYHFETEPIVSEELFQKAQAARNTITYETTGIRKKKHKYNKVAVDLDYGYSLRYRKTKYDYEYFNYIAADLAAKCEKKQLPFDEIDATVLKEMDKAKKLALQLSEKIDTDGDTVKRERLGSLADTAKNQAQILALSERNKMDAYQKYNSGELSKEAYDEAVDKANEALCQVETFFKDEVVSRRQIELAFSDQNPWVTLFLQYEKSAVVDETIIGKYISSVEVRNLEVVGVTTKEVKWLQILPEEWRKGYGEKK